MVRGRTVQGVRALALSLGLLGAPSACNLLVGISESVPFVDAGGAGNAGQAPEASGGAPTSSGDGGKAGSKSTSGGSSAHSGKAGSPSSEAGETGEGGSGDDPTENGGTAATQGGTASGASAGANNGSGSGGAAAGSPSAGSGGAGPLRPGPAEVKVELLTDSFTIDSTEVTVGQYKAFLDAKQGDTSGQNPDFCAWNDSYAPAPGESPGPLDHPMTYVDWCDARAYCEWAGKHLCGAVGGGAIAKSEFTDAGTSQWMRACGGVGSVPTVQNSDIPTRPCNTGGENTFPAGSTCEGSFNGLFDMVGNVKEWVDSCTGADASASASAECIAAGESYWDNVPPNGVRCDHYGTELRRDTRSSIVGFRCCGEL